MSWTLDAEQWSDFVRDHWEKHPCVIRQPFSTPLVTAQELHQVIRAGAQAWKDGERVGFSIQLDGRLLQVGAEPYLPAAHDKDLTCYFRRILDLAGSQQFMFGMVGLQAYAPDLWHKTVAFLRGLYRCIGLPSSHAELETFMGHYGLTPFGIHQDTSSNFAYVVQGHKKMLFWPDAHFGKERRRFPVWINQNIDASDMAPHMQGAIVLEAEPGDIIYWPSDHWHTAAPDVGPSAVLAMALYVRGRASKLAQRAVEQLSAVSSQHPTLEGRAEIPTLYSDAAFNLKGAGDDGAVADVLCRMWATHRSGYGFATVPDPAPEAPLLDSAWVRLSDEVLLLDMPIAENKRLVYAWGLCHDVDDGPAVRLLLEHLRSHGRFQVSALKNMCSEQEIIRDRLHVLLVRLQAARALVTL